MLFILKKKIVRIKIEKILLIRANLSGSYCIKMNDNRLIFISKKQYERICYKFSKMRKSGIILN